MAHQLEDAAARNASDPALAGTSDPAWHSPCYAVAAASREEAAGLAWAYENSPDANPQVSYHPNDLTQAIRDRYQVFAVQFGNRDAKILCTVHHWDDASG